MLFMVIEHCVTGAAPALLQEWVPKWEDLARFEVVPVTPSTVAAGVVTN
jgi:hypothetical protein